MHYLIYKTTNTVNNKIYVGCHITNNLDDGYIGSGLILQKAIEKYGKDKFKREILFDLPNEDEMFDMEKDIVNEEFIARLDTYNLTVGGREGGWYYCNKYGHNVKNKQYIKGGESKKKKLENEEYLEEIKQKISNGLTLYFQENDSWWIGRKHSEETKKKIGEANSKKQKGKSNSQYGKCWIYNEELKTSKSIPKKELDEFLSLGWKKGRKIKF